VAQWANALAEPQCSEPGWLAQAAWVRLMLLMACQVRFLHAMRLLLERHRGFACVLFQMSSHLDWGHLGVVRAASADNRWQGPAVLYEGRTLAPCQRNPPAKLGSINIQYKPQS